MINPSIQTQVKCPVCNGKTSYGQSETGVALQCHNRCWKSGERHTIADAIYFGRIEAAEYIKSHGGSPDAHLTPGRVFSEDEVSEHFAEKPLA